MSCLTMGTLNTVAERASCHPQTRVRPGFVSSVFHVHLWLIPLALSYLIILHHAEEKEAASVKFLGSLLLSLVLAFIVWRERLVFDDFFILALVAVLLLPFIMRNTLNKFSE